MKALINLEPGVAVDYDGKHYVITHILSLEAVIGKDQENGKSKELRIADLTPVAAVSQEFKVQNKDLSIIKTEDRENAELWFKRIRPLLSTTRRTYEMIEEVAKGAGVHVSTVYRKLAMYEQTGRVSALCPSKPDGGKGKSRIASEAETILQNTIRDFYLNKQKPSIRRTIDEVERRFCNAKIKPPHRNTIYKRIKALSDEDKDKTRLGAKQSADKHSAFPGHFPGGDWPLAVVQIDHTLLDVTLVDDKNRQSVGRPWLTLAIDAFSRMVAGYYLSLDPPNSMSVGLCIAHAILPKEQWLARYEINTPWLCWGVMRLIHADNAREFRSNMLRRACKEYGIDLEWRPVKQPHYGAYIESLLGTFLEEIHSLPGTTFSNPEERGEYDSEKHSAMTFSEFERWLVTFITGVYHQREHSSLLTSPIRQYEKGIFGTEDMAGRGLPLQVTDADRLRLDLMPYVERTIQEYGVEIDRIHYFSDVLRRFVHSKVPDNPKRKRKFIFKRDPRDISVAYFYDPELNQYFSVPYRDSSRPPLSIWEFRAARNRLIEQGTKDINEALIFDSYTQMLSQVEEAKRKTKAMRRADQRRQLNKQIIKPMAGSANSQAPIENKLSADFASTPTIAPFEEIEEL